MPDTKHTIWCSDIDTDAAIEDLRDRLGDGLMDDALRCIAWQDNNQLLVDEKLNLQHIAPENGILFIARLGLWNGSPLAILPDYKRDELQTVSDCMQYYCRSGTSDIDIYVDQYGDLRIQETHHDGTNQYLFRAWKPDVTDEQKDDMYALILQNSPAVKDKLTELTVRLGDDIGKVYGWDFPEPVPPEI